MTGTPKYNPLHMDIKEALPERYRRHHMWWLLLLPLLCLVAAVAKESFGDAMDSFVPETAPITSTHNKRASGYTGLYELATKMGLQAQRFERSYRYLKSRHGTLVMIGPWESPTLAESKELVRWLAAGNNLVLLDDFATPSSKIILAGLGLEFDPAQPKEEVISIAPGVPESKLVDTIKAPCEGHLSGEIATIARDAGGAVLMQATLGKGRCLVGTLPALCSNQYLSDPAAKGNFQFLINWLSSSDQPIYFDEKCHGYSAGENAFAFLLKNKVGYLAMQLLIVCLVSIFSLNQRFGQAVPEKSARKISNLEFINGLAYALSRAHSRDAAFAMIFQPFKARLCKALAVSPHEPAANLAHAWASASGQPAQELQSLLEQGQAALDQRRLSEDELKQLIRRLDTIAAKSAGISSFARTSSIS
jgi:hypothetical protein